MIWAAAWAGALCQAGLGGAMMANGNGIGLLLMLSSLFTLMAVSPSATRHPPSVCPPLSLSALRSASVDCIIDQRAVHRAQAVVLRQWVPFAVAMFETAAEILDEHPGLVRIGLAGLFAEVLWLGVWATGLVAAMRVESTSSMALLLLGLYWPANLIKSVVHVTAAGATASWYFQTGEPKASVASFRRACTTSLGSVCLGALVTSGPPSASSTHCEGGAHHPRGPSPGGRPSNRSIADPPPPHGLCVRACAVVRVMLLLQSLARPGRGGATSNSGCGALLRVCCASSYGGVVGKAAAAFNQFAFTQIAINGLPYSDSARAAWGLIQAKGVLPLLHNHLIGMVTSQHMDCPPEYMSLIPSDCGATRYLSIEWP